MSSFVAAAAATEEAEVWVFALGEALEAVVALMLLRKGDGIFGALEFSIAKVFGFFIGVPVRLRVVATILKRRRGPALKARKEISLSRSKGKLQRNVSPNFSYFYRGLFLSLRLMNIVS